jgi:NAD-dependent dihydropyrimidine dehydrogenase PreA subunit
MRKASRWILDKNHLSYWLRQLRKERELIGPLREKNGDIVFRSVEQIHEVALDCSALLPSPKEFLFPQYEPLFRVEEKRGGVLNPVSLADRNRRVVFGVRSCDISAITLLDRFYFSQFDDSYYCARRRNTLFISIVCKTPDPTCFCIGLQTGPYLERGFDIQLTDLGDRYLVQADTKEGIRTIREMAFLFERPRKSDLDDQYEAFLSAKARFQKIIGLEGPRQAILGGKVSDDFWESVTERCFECGGCVYECPLCTCFTVTDRVYEDSTERARLWDTCLFKGFTRMAGGVLPNKKRILRTKRWYFHKLIHYPDTLGEFGCVGCGRCTITCPGKIDMATIATRIKGLAMNGELR